MNNPHKNARMTPLGRAEMVRRIVEDGRPVAEVAAGFGVSERTARKWLCRWRSEGSAGLENRSSRPRSLDDGASRFWKDAAARLRREYRLTGEEIADKLRMARSTVAGWLTGMGLGGVRVERVMTDNGSGYVSRLFRKVLRMLGIRHIRTRPYTPKTNGKAERFIQTMLREWAYAIPFQSSDRRVADLPRWLAWYNQHRPHASLAKRTPAQALAGTT